MLFIDNNETPDTRVKFYCLFHEVNLEIFSLINAPLLENVNAPGAFIRRNTVGYIECGATACADDITLNCTDPTEAQIMLNMAYNYSCIEQYKLQLQKSVVIQMESKKKSRHNPIELKMKYTILSNVETATHLGIQRSKTDKETIKNTVDENIKKSKYQNIKKARHTAYSLMSAGCHGNNGLDLSTSIHILKTYVIPTITYDLEVLIPDKKNITRLDCFFK